MADPNDLEDSQSAPGLIPLTQLVGDDPEADDDSVSPFDEPSVELMHEDLIPLAMDDGKAFPVCKSTHVQCESDHLSFNKSQPHQDWMDLTSFAVDVEFVRASAAEVKLEIDCSGCDLMPFMDCPSFNISQPDCDWTDLASSVVNLDIVRAYAAKVKPPVL